MSEFKAPEGWALVPVKPTQSMVNAAKEIDGRLSVWKWADGYTAMLNQAPKPPEDHIPDAGKMVDEAAMARLHENGRKAWAFLGDRSASDWVDEIRGNEETCSVLIDGKAHEVSMPVAAELLRLNMLIQQRQDCEPWGWAIVDKNGDDVKKRVRQINFFGAVNHQQEPLTQEDVEQADRDWPGLAPCRLVTLYAAPPKREPLSEDEIKQIEFTVRAYKREPLDVVAFASAIERAHGIGGQS